MADSSKKMSLMGLTVLRLHPRGHAHQSYAAFRAQLTTAPAKFAATAFILAGVYVINQLGIADRNERIQAMEGMLEMPGSVARYVRVPSHDELPPGPLATSRLDEKLLQLGLATAEEIAAPIELMDERSVGLVAVPLCPSRLHDRVPNKVARRNQQVERSRTASA